jgi:hypothetical protein
VTYEELQRLVSVAPPGTVIHVTSIRLPEVPSAPAPDAVSGSTNSAPVAEWTPETVVAWVRERYGDTGLKLKSWVHLLASAGLSVRSLKTAIKEGNLQFHRKPNERDHGAYMVGPDAMLEYLRIRGEVR